jgi:tetratricopeptide (TPR) repeat protein
MLHLFSRSLRALGLPIRVAVRRPRTFILVLVLLTGVALFTAWRYAVGEWQQAEVAVREERLADAQQRLNFCLQVWPYSPEVHLLTARAARRAGDLKTAESHLNRCLELQRGATDDIQREFLLLRVQTGEVDELAPVLFELVEQGHPDFREILDTISKSYIVRLRYKPAFACLSKWIELEPTNAKPYYWRGVVLERLNNQKLANADYTRAIEIDPGLVPARLRIAEMLLEDKQAPEALPHLELLIQQAPNDPMVKARMGICLFLQGRGNEARRLMEEAAVTLPNDPALLVALGNLELQEGRAEAAERWLRQVLKTDSSDTEALFVLVSALQLQGRSAEADAALVEYKSKRELVEKINQFLKDKADDPSTSAAEYAEVGSMFLQINRDKLGVYWLKKSLERDPKCQPAHRALAEYYERKNDPSAADHRRQLRGSGLPEPKPPTGSDTPNPKKP